MEHSCRVGEEKDIVRLGNRILDLRKLYSKDAFHQNTRLDNKYRDKVHHEQLLLFLDRKDAEYSVPKKQLL